ncbi:hypothetical protein DUI87_05930 [Hirundo rustica rustica]|uniref:Uncharacterized protein n=1 Tax=Hirundo rustica rustica TaxID=333673 RepID=A0A3M0KVM6_HIRRU|nr:hypothetical protein DUI87_05930 [Hirundo rustica rustica]
MGRGIGKGTNQGEDPKRTNRLGLTTRWPSEVWKYACPFSVVVDYVEIYYWTTICKSCDTTLAGVLKREKKREREEEEKRREEKRKREKRREEKRREEKRREEKRRREEKKRREEKRRERREEKRREEKRREEKREEKRREREEKREKKSSHRVKVDNALLK